MPSEPPVIEKSDDRKVPHLIIWSAAILLLAIVAAYLVWFLTGGSAPVEKPVDLASAYTGSTSDSTNVRNDSRNQDNLEEFPVGVNEFGGIRFSVNGVILLNGRHPDRAEGIPLNQKCERVHLLHGTTGKMPDGAPIARLVLHYAGGQQAELVIKYGEHVRDWWQRPGDPEPEPPLMVAWRGQNRLTRREGASLNVYLTTFENPRRKDRIKSVDFVSGNTRCCPFFLGLSTE
jgi:hypothetical protein